MTEHILLVEPAASVAQLVKQDLEAAGMEVIAARDSQTACDLLESYPAELVLIESNLYGSGGLDLVASIRRSRSLTGLPVIILGSQEGSDDNVRWLEAGADSTIPRPFSAAVLVARLRALLRRVGQKSKTHTE
jgi:DNA-binding response OmpR family regulator